jgi:hypothetical protein|tara:strand:- start:684 stop:968 length:285 start_codon:yes stop_codon:yes gene_type:complete
MKRLKNLREMMQESLNGQTPTSSPKFMQLQIDVATQLKDHVLKGICTYCGGRVFLKKFKTREEKHDYHHHGMCHACIVEMHKEPKSQEDLRWQN